MLKSRRVSSEEEGIKLGLRPTKDLEIDESLLTKEEKPHFEFPWLGFSIIAGLILVAIIFIIVIVCTGGPI